MITNAWIKIDDGETFEGDFGHWNDCFCSLTRDGREISVAEKIAIIVDYVDNGPFMGSKLEITVS